MTRATEAAATVRERLGEWCSYENDADVRAILRELIRACDPARHLLLVRDKAAVAAIEQAILAACLAPAVIYMARHVAAAVQNALRVHGVSL